MFAYFIKKGNVKKAGTVHRFEHEKNEDKSGKTR